ncbi:MAG: NTP transferase domain-containing protein [Bacteroidota bacterium]
MKVTAPLAGLVLAGGYSRRMGQDKGLLQWHSTPQRERLINLLGMAGVENITLSLRKDQVGAVVDLGVEIMVDQIEEGGPGAVLHQAWHQYPDRAWLVLACDLPGVEEATLAALLRARDPSGYATAFVDPETGWETPLCAIWEPKAAPEFIPVEGKSRGPLKILRRMKVRRIEPAHPEWLFHANTREERDVWLNKRMKKR